jgi:hypothetical protein
MRRRDVINAIAFSIILWALAARAEQLVLPVLAQANCESVPVGPARTDCYIGLTRFLLALHSEKKIWPSIAE